MFHADAVDEVKVNVEHNRNLRLLADGRDGFQHLGRRGAGFETALRGELVHQTVGKRIAERHAQFQNIHAGFVKSQSQFARGIQIRIARADIHNKTFFTLAFEPGKTFLNAIHAAGSLLGRDELYEFQTSKK